METNREISLDQEPKLNEEQINRLKEKYREYEEKVINELNRLLEERCSKEIGDELSGEDKDTEVFTRSYLKKSEILERMRKEIAKDKGMVVLEIDRYAAYHFFGSTPDIGGQVMAFDLPDGFIEKFLRNEIEKLKRENQE